MSEAFGVTLLALGVYRATRLLVRDTLTLHWQRWLARRWPDPEGEGTKSPLGCPYCLSVYLSALFTAGGWALGIVGHRLVLLPFEAWGIAGAVSALWGLVEDR